MVRAGVEPGVRVYSTSAAEILIEQEGIIVVRFRERVRLTAGNTAEAVSAYLAAAAGARCAMLADARGIVAADRDARQLAAGSEVVAATSAMAVLVGNPVTRVLGSFFMRVTGPSYPVRLFSEEAQARAWLRATRA